MTTNQIIDLARDVILEQTEEIVSDADLLLYANLAKNDIEKEAFPASSVESATVTFTNGVGAFPSGFGTLYGDALDSNGNSFPEVSIADFARANGSGYGLVVENGQFRVSPSTTGSLTIRYYPTYTDLSAGTTPDVPVYLHESIVDGILWRAFRKLQDFELSQYYKNEFKVNLKDRLGVLSNYEEESQRGGTMFNGINIMGNGVNNDPNHW